MSEVAGWILYDDSCGFCRRWVPFWETTLQRRGFAIAPLQESWIQERLRELRVAPLDDIQLLLASGQLVSGPEAYRYAMRRIWWVYPVFVLSMVPGLRRAFDGAYRWFARHRHEVSRVCGLTVAPVDRR